jgi:F0F1-type ATP synthase assembly protein I
VKESPDDGRDRKLAGYLKYSGAGLQLFAAVGACTLLGWWLDGKTGLSPILLIAGAFFGFFAGFYTLYRELFGRKK